MTASVINPETLDKNYGDKNVPKGMVLSQVATYTILAAGDPGIGDTALMMKLPLGATILDIILEADNGTGSMTVDLGDGTTVDLWMDGVDASAAFLQHAQSALGVALAAETSIYITFLTAAPTATHVYTLTVLYTMAG